VRCWRFQPRADGPDAGDCLRIRFMPISCGLWGCDITTPKGVARCARPRSCSSVDPRLRRGATGASVIVRGWGGLTAHGLNRQTWSKRVSGKSGRTYPHHAQMRVLQPFLECIHRRQMHHRFPHAWVSSSSSVATCSRQMRHTAAASRRGELCDGKGKTCASPRSNHALDCPPAGL
jgi:hypothetical protein